MILDKANISNLNLESGDIFATKGKEPLGWCLRQLIEPPTDRFHFGLVWMPTDDHQDRVILESQGEGTLLETVVDLFLHLILRKGAVGQAVCIGRLSFYHGADIEFYRPATIPKKERRQAPAALSAYGRDGYDYDYITKLVLRSIKLWLQIAVRERRFRRLRVYEIPVVEQNRALICTVAPDMGYRLIGHMLIPLGTTATPNAYAQLLKEGVLTKLEEDCNAIHTTGTAPKP